MNVDGNIEQGYQWEQLFDCRLNTYLKAISSLECLSQNLRKEGLILFMTRILKICEFPNVNKLLKMTNTLKSKIFM